MLKRCVTGAVGIGLTAFFITMGGYFFFFAVCFLAVTAWREYDDAFKNVDLPVQKTMGLIVISLLLCVTQVNGVMGALGATMLGTLILFLGALIYFEKGGFNAASVSVAGFIYIGLAFSHLLLLRAYQPESIIHTFIGDFTMGEAMLWLMFIGTWASDSFAYFVGSKMGRQLLCENISPKKTVEGFVGAVIGTTLVVFLIGHFFFGFNFLLMTPLGIALSIFGSLGDLVESSLKRYVNIKDSGRLFPGHGGVLDRFDSVLFNAPLAYYYALFVM